MYKYVGAEVNLPFHGSMNKIMVARRARNEEVDIYGTNNANPILDYRGYDVDFPNGWVSK